MRPGNAKRSTRVGLIGGFQRFFSSHRTAHLLVRPTMDDRGATSRAAGRVISIAVYPGLSNKLSSRRKCVCALTVRALEASTRAPRSVECGRSRGSLSHLRSSPTTTSFHSPFIYFRVILLVNSYKVEATSYRSTLTSVTESNAISART